jgi:hypothetical protein
MNYKLDTSNFLEHSYVKFSKDDNFNNFKVLENIDMKIEITDTPNSVIHKIVENINFDILKELNLKFSYEGNFFYLLLQNGNIVFTVLKYNGKLQNIMTNIPSCVDIINFNITSNDIYNTYKNHTEDFFCNLPITLKQLNIICEVSISSITNLNCLFVNIPFSCCVKVISVLHKSRPKNNNQPKNNIQDVKYEWNDEDSDSDNDDDCCDCDMEFYTENEEFIMSSLYNDIDEIILTSLLTNKKYIIKRLTDAYRPTVDFSYASNYNILRIMSGMDGLCNSN